MDLKKGSNICIKRAAFSLVECLVACGLFSLVLTTVAVLFWHYSRYETTIQKKLTEFGQLQMRSNEMRDRLSRAVFGNDKKYTFYTIDEESQEEVGKSLVFTYHAGVDPDPFFSNVNIGKIYLNHDGDLCIASWPDPKLYSIDHPPMRKEILFSHVDKFCLKFFYCKQSTASHDKKVVPEYGVWTDTWSKEYRIQPQMVKIDLSFQEDTGLEDLSFHCLIPRGFPLILY